MSIFLKTTLFQLIESNGNKTNNIRHYARWTHRRPSRVFSPEEYEKIERKENDDNVIELENNPRLKPKANQARQTESKLKWVPKNIQSKSPLINMEALEKNSEPIVYKIDSKLGKRKKVSYKMLSANTKNQTDMLETVIDANGELVFTKCPNNDPRIGQLMIMVKSRSEQIKKDLALLEGKRLIKDALKANCTLKHLIFSRKNDIEYLKPYLPKIGAKLYKLPYREIQLWSDLTTTPGIMGIFKTPAVEDYSSAGNNALPITIICDNIREPGNLGAILRTAAGVGAQDVLLTKGCVDLWDTKVLRSACGAHFSLQIHRKMEWDDIKRRVVESSASLFIADNKIISPDMEEGQTTLTDVIESMPLLPYYGVKFNDLSHVGLIIGSESEGISETSYRLAAEFNGARLNIPLNNNVDSLNTGTALGVIIFEMKRQLAQSRE